MSNAKLYRGEIWWGEQVDYHKEGYSFRRPLLIVQTNRLNQSEIDTVLVVPISSNLKLAKAPGNVLLESKVSGLPKDSVVKVAQITYVDKFSLTEKVGRVSHTTMRQIELGLQLVLSLELYAN